jgi:hypothetical protein
MTAARWPAARRALFRPGCGGHFKQKRHIMITTAAATIALNKLLAWDGNVRKPSPKRVTKKFIKPTDS